MIVQEKRKNYMEIMRKENKDRKRDKDRYSKEDR